MFEEDDLMHLDFQELVSYCHKGIVRSYIRIKQAELAARLESMSLDSPANIVLFIRQIKWEGEASL